MEFEQRTLPQAIEDTRSIYPQLDNLPSESQAALVSLVYNRGNDLSGKDTMINIQEDLRNGNLKNIPGEFYAMEPLQKVLASRRHREGDLFAKGLVQQSQK